MNFDDLVESDEDFIIMMALVTPTGTNFRLDRAEMVIILTDSDGMLLCFGIN